jgi:L-alanine-DL-glutamate epimerase-like enolase superfamily enzyme
MTDSKAIADLRATVVNVPGTGPRWCVTGGGVMPPPRAGLGVTLDREGLAHYHARDQAEGPLSHYDRP